MEKEEEEGEKGRNGRLNTYRNDTIRRRKGTEMINGENKRENEE